MSVTTEDRYKYLSLFLGILALLFLGLYITKSETSVTDILRSVNRDLGECEVRVRQWRMTYLTPPTQEISDDARRALDDILGDCQAIALESQEKI
ncbi:hypothetical protein HY478_01205 [Candidatus Uhrbacteria bacterium]|nr:hypothetical protein [Candidatus Uhrbacteria bacterium]